MVEHRTDYIALPSGSDLVKMDIRTGRIKRMDRPMRILTGIALTTAMIAYTFGNDGQNPIGSPTLTIQPTATSTLEPTMTPDTTPTIALLKSINLP